MKLSRSFPSSSNPCLMYASGNGTLQAQDRNGAFSLIGTGALRYQAAKPSRENLAINPSFETNTAGWAIATSGTMTRITNDGAQGTCSLEISGSGIGDGAGVNVGAVNAFMLPIASKTAHTLSIHAKRVSGATDWRIEIHERDWSGTVLGAATNVPITLTGAWTRYATTYTPTQASTVYITFKLTRASANAATARIDGLQIEQGSVATSYLEGNAGDGARTNYVKNPSFETNTTLWVGRTATITRIVGDGTQGGACVEVSGNSANNGLGMTNGLSAPLPNKNPITLSWDCKWMSGTTQWQIEISEKDAVGNSVAATTYVPFTPTANWKRFSYVYTPSAAAMSYVLFHITINNGISNPGVVRVDGVCIEQGAIANPTYFDGSTGGAWLDPITGQLGTAHASPSVTRAAFWIEEGTTNTIPDPIFGNATVSANWQVNNTGVTLTRDTTFSSYGLASAKVVCDGTGSSQGIAQVGPSGAAAAQGQAWTLQTRIRANSAADVGKTVKLDIAERDSGNALLVEQQGGAITLTDSWQLVTFTATLSNAATAKVTMKIVTPSAQAVTFNVDGVQLEQKPYATSLCAGSLGSGYSWSGTAHASSSTRAATSVTTTQQQRISADRGSLVALVSLPKTGPSTAVFVAGGAFGPGEWYSFSKGVSSSQTRWKSGANAVTTKSGPSVPTTAFFTYYASWDGVNVAVSVDGANLSSGTRDAPMALSPNDTMQLGFGTTTEYVNGPIGPVAIYARPFTNAELATALALGSNLVFNPFGGPSFLRPNVNRQGRNPRVARNTPKPPSIARTPK